MARADKGRQGLIRADKGYSGGQNNDGGEGIPKYNLFFLCSVRKCKVSPPTHSLLIVERVSVNQSGTKTRKHIILTVYNI